MAKANHEVVLAVQSSEVASNSVSNSKTMWSSVESFLGKYWKKMFVASCLFAVLLDPLFLYIPVIRDKDDMKCLQMDTTLKITALILRAFTDLFYIVDIIYQIYSSEELRSRIGNLRFSQKSFFPGVAKMNWESFIILIDILAILPFTQVMVLIFFSRMIDSRSLSLTKGIMNLLVLSHYVPRVLRIYLSIREFQLTGESEKTAIWVKGVLNFFMYILVSHVLGAVWYFFAIQRMTICWQSGCGNENGCETNRSFGCHAGIHESRNYFQKISNCFSWGLRNLSSLGSNLAPSVDGWENLFTAFISIIGLLLFIYLIGNLQTYMQLDMGRREDRRHKLKIQKKIEEKSGAVDEWLANKGVPERSTKEIKIHIMEKVRVEVEDERDVHLDSILYTLPRESQNLIKSCSPWTKLKQEVPVLDGMDELDLKEICKCFKRKNYSNDEIIIEAGKPLEMVLFILDGCVVSYHEWETCIEEETSYGKSVVYWLLHAHYRKNETVILPKNSVRAGGEVEALVLTASDIKSVLSRFMLHFKGDYDTLKQELDNHLADTRTLETFTEQEYLRFDEAEEIARGAHSTMYKVVIRKDGRVLTHAVKRYRNGFDRLNNEVAVLSLINHENVVKLLGRLQETADQAALVLEYAGLRYYEREVSFEDRMDVAVDISGALRYLHSSCGKPSIVHQNVNLEHVVLDDCDGVYTAKLAGFGSSQFIPKGQTQIQVAQVVQSGDDMMTYVDPEFIESGILSDKVDVYSFGGVLVELLTGRKPYSSKKLEAERKLATLELYGFMEILDGADMNRAGYIKMAKKVADLAKSCLRDKGNERPTMAIVHLELKEVTKSKMVSRYDRRNKAIIERRIMEKSGEVDRWLAQRGIPEGSNEKIKFHIMEKVRQQLVEDKNNIYSLDTIFYTLDWGHQNYIKSCMLLTTLKKVPMLETMDELDLKAICDSFKPKKYTNGDIIIPAGEPLGIMLFIVDGSVVSEIGSNNLQLGAGKLYGETVIYWLLRAHFPEYDTVLLATESLRSAGDVEALVLMADDIKSLLSRFILHFRGDCDNFKEELDYRLRHNRTV